MRRTRVWLSGALAALLLFVPTDPARAADGMVAPVLAPWVGDLSGMQERGYVLVERPD